MLGQGAQTRTDEGLYCVAMNLSPLEYIVFMIMYVIEELSWPG